MTVTYTAQVASTSFACFIKLLIRWRGSIYKLMWREFILFVAAYFTISFIYRFTLNDEQKRTFEDIAIYCEQYGSLIPVAFVLGFYVAIVIGRWWDQFMKIPWPDRMALYVTANVQGLDERGRLMRRTMMRYICLSFVITMHSISPAVKKRFPTFHHMTEAGLMLPGEQEILEKIKCQHNKFFVPLGWCTAVVTRARKENRIRDDFAVKTLVDEINEVRGMLATLLNYDWISVPLVYTQVVTIAVYTFFLSCLMGRQFLEKGGKVADMYIPLFTFLQFFFYIGWLKVAESLLNPFGDDDDDFDINWLIDRNLQVAYILVDEMHDDHPELIKDQYWDMLQFDLPYTVGSEMYRSRSKSFLGSAMHLNLDEKDKEFVPLTSIKERDDDKEDSEIEIELGSSHASSQPRDIPRSLSFKRLISTISNSSRDKSHGKLKQSVSKESSSPRKISLTQGRSSSPQTSQSVSKPNDIALSSVSISSQLSEVAPSPSLAHQEVFKMSELELDQQPLLSGSPDSPGNRSANPNQLTRGVSQESTDSQGTVKDAHARLSPIEEITSPKNLKSSDSMSNFLENTSSDEITVLVSPIDEKVTSAARPSTTRHPQPSVSSIPSAQPAASAKASQAGAASFVDPSALPYIDHQLRQDPPVK